MAIWAGTINEYWNENGKKYCAVDIFSDTVPSPFPTDGSTVDKMDDNLQIGKESTIYVIGTGQFFMCDSTGNFIEQ